MNRIILLGLLTAVPAACSDPAAPRTWDRIEIATPAFVADTVDAIVSQPVQVTIRIPDGRPVVGLPITIRATNGFVAGDAGDPGETQLFEVTDAEGRAAVWFQLGASTSEPARLQVHAGVEQTTLELTVRPGAAAALRAVAGDTALVTGRTHTIDVRTVDRHGNPRPGAIDATLTSRRPDIAQVDGSDLTVLAPGKAVIDLSADGLTGTMAVYGMPTGRLALAGHDALFTFDMGDDVLTTVADAGSPCASWHPDGAHVLLENLVIASMTTGEIARIPTGSDSIVAGCGEFTADAEWIYFDGRRGADPWWISHIWRIRPDGTELEQITNVEHRRASMPAPSPDSTHVAYRMDGVYNLAVADFLVVTRLGNATVDTIGPPISTCRTPHCQPGITSVRWSPTGDWIAYTMTTEALTGGGPFVSMIKYGSMVRLIRPDGTDARYIGPPGSEPHHYGFWGGVRWSPDGEWLVGVSFPDSRIRLLHLESNEEVLLNVAVSGSPAWAPQ